MDYKHTSDTIFTRFQGITNNIYGLFGCLEDLFCSFIFYPSTTRLPIFLPVHIRFNRPNDGWTGLYIKLCLRVTGRSVTIWGAALILV